MMHKQLGIGLLLGAIIYGASCAALQSQPLPQNAQKTARVTLAQEFVRELEVIYRLQETAKQEFAKGSSDSGRLVTGIRVDSRTLFEMKDSINRLSMINVDAKWAKFRDALKKLHQERIVLVHEMNQMSKTLVAGPETGINYGTLTARAPEITAQVEQIDKITFTIAKAMFYALVDDGRVGADGKLHHLILTKKDRTSMVQLIDEIFGPTLEDKKASHIVASAWVIKYGLTRPHYKAADEL
jgi:cell division protein FtsB